MPKLDLFYLIVPLVKYESIADHTPNMDVEEIDFFINKKKDSMTNGKWKVTGEEIRNAFDLFEEDADDD